MSLVAARGRDTIAIRTSSLHDQIRRELQAVIVELGLDPAAVDLFDELSRESLSGIDAAGPMPRFSTINNDGMPFQYVLSLGGRKPGVAYLTETGLPGSSVPARIDLTRSRLAAVLPRLGLAGARAPLDAALRAFLPTSIDDLATWRGGIWIAVGCGAPGLGLKVYVNGRRRVAGDGWRATLALLDRADRPRAAQLLSRLMPTLEGMATPAGVAIDLTADGIGTLKAYVRLNRWHWEPLADIVRQAGHGPALPALEGFARQIGADERGRPGSLVFSLEFAADDRAIDVKLDACAHCRFADERSAQGAVLEIARGLDLATADYDRVLPIIAGDPIRGPLRHHAFVGLGLSHHEPIRLNIYLKPHDSGTPADEPSLRSNRRVAHSPRTRLEAAVEGGVGYLLRAQSGTGAWLDFDLPPGPSDGWVTAYVGSALTDIARRRADVAIRAALDRALRWSALAMRPDHLWGYNAFTESDADTSAWMVLFLRANGWRVPARCAEALTGFRRPDGRFATFRDLRPGDSWMDGHADVTPTAIRALRALEAADVADRSKAAVAADQTAEGSWNAYWWSSPWYATWANLSLVEPAGWPYDRTRAATWVGAAPVSEAAFDMALALRCGLLLQDAIDGGSSRIRALAAVLASTQRADGSWTPVPVLRLTAARSHHPWSDQAAARVFADARGIFTTATVVAAMSAALQPPELTGRGTDSPQARGSDRITSSTMSSIGGIGGGDADGKSPTLSESTQ